MQRAVRIAGLFILATSLCACQLTGDPHTGGIFWSPSKARQRADTLRKDDSAAQQQAFDEQQRQQSLQQQKSALESDNSHLQTEVEQLLADNARLAGELQNAVRNRRLGEAELQRLNAILARNEQLRRDPQSPSAARSTALGNQNEELHQEILQLLDR